MLLGGSTNDTDKGKFVFKTAEGCRGVRSEDIMTMTMLREPRSKKKRASPCIVPPSIIIDHLSSPCDCSGHVLSQYFHCTTSEEVGRRFSRDANMPQSFELWLDAWARYSEKVPCYNPRDMQTFGFLCSGSSSHTAYQNAQRTSFIACNEFSCHPVLLLRSLSPIDDSSFCRHQTFNRPDEHRQGAGEEEGDVAKLAHERWVRRTYFGLRTSDCRYTRRECLVACSSCLLVLNLNLSPSEDVAEALQRMRETGLVGITEHFDASLCLLHALAHRRLPAHCDCSSPEAVGRGPRHAVSRHISHGVKKHSVSHNELRCCR